MIYFDYTATTPVDSDVLETYIKSTNNFFANSTSLHSLGQKSNHMVEVCTKTILDTLDIKNYKVIYTANATEANNIAILGWCNKYINDDKRYKIITTKIEHASVFNTFKALEDKFDVVYLDIKKDGKVDLEQLKKEMNKDVLLVSVMWVNNIIGTIQNIKEIVEIVKKYPKAKLHVDAVQGLCKVKPDFDFNEIDMFTVSGHKIYGPKGIAGLLIKDSIVLSPILYGSSNQYGLKPGTLDVALISAFTKAIKKFYPLTEANQMIVKEYFDYLVNEIKDEANIVINTPNFGITNYILNVSIPGIKGETLVHKFEEKGICVSTGSACSSKLAKPEKTIYALTNSPDLASSSIRISLSPLVKYKELDELIKALKEIKELK